MSFLKKNKNTESMNVHFCYSINQSWLYNISTFYYFRKEINKRLTVFWNFDVDVIDGFWDNDIIWR